MIACGPLVPPCLSAPPHSTAVPGDCLLGIPTTSPHLPVSSHQTSSPTGLPGCTPRVTGDRQLAQANGQCSGLFSLSLLAACHVVGPLLGRFPSSLILITGPDQRHKCSRTQSSHLLPSDSHGCPKCSHLAP